MKFQVKWPFNPSPSRLFLVPHSSRRALRHCPCGHINRLLTRFSAFVTNFRLNRFNKLNKRDNLEQYWSHFSTAQPWIKRLRVRLPRPSNNNSPFSMSRTLPREPYKDDVDNAYKSIFTKKNRAWPRWDNVVSRHVKRRSKVNIMCVICDAAYHHGSVVHWRLIMTGVISFA